jgi:hypothetical protein
MEPKEAAGAEDIVILGAGLAGLATALGLHKKGVKTLVLESSPVLRASGFAFTTWKNAFRALDALGVGDKIRKLHLQAQGYVCWLPDPISNLFSLSDLSGLDWLSTSLRPPIKFSVLVLIVHRLRVMASSTGEIVQEADFTQQGKR